MKPTFLFLNTVTYISKLVVPEMRLVAFEQLHGQVTVLSVTLLQTDRWTDRQTELMHTVFPTY